jgi:hypothetical protein
VRSEWKKYVRLSAAASFSRPRFRKRTWGTLRAAAVCEGEKIFSFGRYSCLRGSGFDTDVKVNCKTQVQKANLGHPSRCCGLRMGENLLVRSTLLFERLGLRCW